MRPLPLARMRPRSVATTASSVLRVGVCADVQAADIPDGASFHGRPRYYRAAFDGAARAGEAWRREGATHVLHLVGWGHWAGENEVGGAPAAAGRPPPLSPSPPQGDVLDTQAGPPSPASRALLDRVLTGLAGGRRDARVHSCVGNHCLAAVGRAHLNARLGVPPPPAAGDHSYYEARLGPGWRLVVLDGYDVSLLGWPAADARHAAAAALLAARNPNANKNTADGLVGVERRFVAFGGGVGDGQLEWLDRVLAAAAAGGDRVILAVHQAIHPDTAPPVCLLWNYDRVLASVAAAGPSVVALTLAGHAHGDGEATCAAGVRHRVLKAVLETAPGGDAYATLDLHEDRVVLRGVGVASTTVDLPPLPARKAAM